MLFMLYMLFMFCHYSKTTCFHGKNLDKYKEYNKRECTDTRGPHTKNMVMFHNMLYLYVISICSAPLHNKYGPKPLWRQFK